MQYQYTPSEKAQALIDYFDPQSSADVSGLIDQALLATFGDKKSIQEKIVELDAKSAALKLIIQ